LKFFTFEKYKQENISYLKISSFPIQCITFGEYLWRILIFGSTLFSIFYSLSIFFLIFFVTPWWIRILQSMCWYKDSILWIYVQNREILFLGKYSVNLCYLCRWPQISSFSFKFFWSRGYFSTKKLPKWFKWHPIGGTLNCL